MLPHDWVLGPSKKHPGASWSSSALPSRLHHEICWVLQVVVMRTNRQLQTNSWGSPMYINGGDMDLQMSGMGACGGRIEKKSLQGGVLGISRPLEMLQYFFRELRQHTSHFNTWGITNSCSKALGCGIKNTIASSKLRSLLT